MTAPEDSQRLRLQEQYRTCILGSHILHHHGILDAYGHLSFRHPSRSDIFIMPRNMAPANIASQDDLVQYQVSDTIAVDSAAPPGYIERYIHSEIYKKYPSVNSVIHSHSHDVTAYTISDVPFRASFHMAGFLGISTPNYDIAQHYQPGDAHDFLIRNERLGESLAACFDGPGAGSDSAATTRSEKPYHCVSLMRGHGFTVLAPNIEHCVYRAIYTRENAVLQSKSLALSAAHHGRTAGHPGVRYLDEKEAEASAAMNGWAWTRAWELWIREVEAAGLYRCND